MKREHKRVLKKKLSNDSSYERPSMKCPKVTDEKASLDDQHYLTKKNNFWKETSSHIESQNKQKNFTEITLANSVENYGKDIQKTHKNNVNGNKSLTNHSSNLNDPNQLYSCVEIFGNNTLAVPSATEGPADILESK